MNTDNMKILGTSNLAPDTVFAEKNKQTRQAGAIVVEVAIAMIIMAAIISFAIPLVKDISSEAIDEQAEKISKHYP